MGSERDGGEWRGEGERERGKSGEGREHGRRGSRLSPLSARGRPSGAAAVRGGSREGRCAMEGVRCAVAGCEGR